MMEKRQPFNKQDIFMEKTETRSMSFILYKFQSMWIKHLNMTPETLRLMQEKVGHTLEAIGIGNNFLNRTQMTQQLRERIDRCYHTKLKSFCTTKEMVSKIEEAKHKIGETLC
jgi:uncharacterized protein YbcC (UPF0753/DUF2309 family)